jgi:hypothetical protein
VRHRAAAQRRHACLTRAEHRARNPNRSALPAQARAPRARTDRANARRARPDWPRARSLEWRSCPYPPAFSRAALKRLSRGVFDLDQVAPPPATRQSRRACPAGARRMRACERPAHTAAAEEFKDDA